MKRLHFFREPVVTGTNLGNWRLDIPSGLWRLNTFTAQIVGAGAVISRLAVLNIDVNMPSYRILGMSGPVNGDFNGVFTFQRGVNPQGNDFYQPTTGVGFVQFIDSAASLGVAPLGDTLLRGESRLGFTHSAGAAASTYSFYGELELMFDADELAA